MPLVASSTMPAVFAVSDVKSATKKIPAKSCKTVFEGISEYLVEYANPWTGQLIPSPGHALLHAVELAWGKHYPLVLSPDVIWLTIAQGVALHLRLHSEELRSKLVSFAGQKAVVVRRDMVVGSPDNDWDEVITEFAGKISTEAPDLASFFQPQFSTTGPRERVVNNLALMDAASPYFHYVMLMICGIPQIGLTGKTEDWEKLASRVEQLSKFGLDWWMPALRRIVEQFVNATKGIVDIEFWRGIFTMSEGCNGPFRYTGWINQLFPYVKPEQPKRNPSVVTLDVFTGFGIYDFPCGITQVPFKLVIDRGKLSVGKLLKKLFSKGGEPLENVLDMEFLSGFVGVSQDEQTLALRPEVGWAVCNKSKGLTKYGKLAAQFHAAQERQ